MKEILWINAKSKEKKALKMIENKHQKDVRDLKDNVISKEEYYLRTQLLIKTLDWVKYKFDKIYESEVL